MHVGLEGGDKDTLGDICRSPVLYIFEQRGCNLNKMSDEPLFVRDVALGEQLPGHYGTY